MTEEGDERDCHGLSDCWLGSDRLGSASVISQRLPVIAVPMSLCTSHVIKLHSDKAREPADCALDDSTKVSNWTVLIAILDYFGAIYRFVFSFLCKNERFEVMSNLASADFPLLALIASLSESTGSCMGSFLCKSAQYPCTIELLL